jgi:hypothetical protein
MYRLLELHVIRARHAHHDHATVLTFLDWAARLRAFARNSSTVASMSPARQMTLIVLGEAGEEFAESAPAHGP